MAKRKSQRDTAGKRVSRKGENKPAARGFVLSPRDVSRLKAEVEERGPGKRICVPNPHNKGFYYFLVETLKALGVKRNQVRYYQISRVRNSPRTDHPLKAYIPPGRWSRRS